jgi:hypothetical protein
MQRRRIAAAVVPAEAALRRHGDKLPTPALAVAVIALCGVRATALRAAVPSLALLELSTVHRLLQLVPFNVATLAVSLRGGRRGAGASLGDTAPQHFQLSTLMLQTGAGWQAEAADNTALVERLQGMPCLRAVVLRGLTAAPWVAALTAHCRSAKLRRLDLSGARDIGDGAGSDATLIAFVQRFATSLLHVRLASAPVGDAAVLALAACCPQLRSLNVDFSDGAVTDASIIAVAERCGDLRRLSVSGTEGAVTDVAICVVAERCPRLRRLDVSDTCGKVTDVSVAWVAEHCPLLARLAVDFTEGKVTDASLRLLPPGCVVSR